MAADAIRCPRCGAERPANAPEGLCARCLTSPAVTGKTLGPADLDATIAHATTDPDHSPAPTQADSDPQATPPGEIPDLPINRSRDSDEDADSISVDDFVRAVDDLGLLDGAEATAFLAQDRGGATADQ